MGLWDISIHKAAISQIYDMYTQVTPETRSQS